MTQCVKLVGKLSQKASLFGRLSVASGTSKSDHYLSGYQISISTKKIKTAVYPYEIINEEE